MSKEENREKLAELSPVLSDLWNGLKESEVELKEEKPVVKEKTKKKKSKQVEPEESKSEEEVSTYQPPEVTPEEPKEEKFPGFDFNNFYEKGQRIFLVKVHSQTKSKVLCGKTIPLTIRTIYPKTIVASYKKGTCEVIGADEKDCIFVHLIDAEQYFNSLDLKDEDSAEKQPKKMEDSDIEEEVEDEFSNEKEPMPTEIEE